MDQVLVTDVGSEGKNGVKVLAVGSTGTLGRGEEVGTEGGGQELIVETLLEDHDTGVGQVDATIDVRV